ncbi:MAG: inositol monophosphatase [Calditrichaeota bacterium]|nr:inositol monophosphatase [Calditrichota bacterium]
MPEESQQLLSIAVAACREAGGLLLENFGQLTAAAVDEKAKNDFVTALDRASEKAVIDLIRSRYPEHDILAEESGAALRNSDYRWIIDPLDGTTNFIKQIPFFAISIAVFYRGQAQAAAVFNPALGELFTALRHGGAFLNGKAIQVSSQNDFSRAFLATGFPHHAKFHLPPFVRAFSDIFYHAAGVRRLGSAALDLCYTACGRFEGFWELGLKPWDIAGGSLILQEAGGQVSDFRGADGYLDSGFVAAGNPATHLRLIEILSHHFEV